MFPESCHCSVSVFSGKKHKWEKWWCGIWVIKHQRIYSSQQHYKHFDIEKVLQHIYMFPSSRNSVVTWEKTSFKLSAQQEMHLRPCMSLTGELTGDCSMLGALEERNRLVDCFSPQRSDITITIIGTTRGQVKPGCSELCDCGSARLQGPLSAGKYCRGSIYISRANSGDGSSLQELADADDSNPW